MPEHEIERERIVEREVPVRRRTVVEHRGGSGIGFNPFAGVLMALVAVLVLVLLLGLI